MSTGKKVCNVFGIILAVPVNILLVVILMVAPLLFSMIAFVQPENLADTVSKVYMSEVVTEIIQAPEGETLPAELEQIGAFLETDTAKELMGIYAEDITNALYGKTDEFSFNSEKIMEIVDANMDEILEIVKEISPEVEEIPAEELKTEIRGAIDEMAEQVVEALPAPEEVKTQIVEQSEEMKLALEILGQLDTIKWSLAGVIAALALLVFVLRLFGFRGFRWLAVDLLIAAVISGLMCAAVFSTPTLLTDLAAGNQLLSSLLGTVAFGFAKGMLIRTVIMLVCGVALLVAFICIRKAQKRKAVVVIPAAPVAAEELPASEEE